MKKYITILLCFFLWSCSEEKIPFYSGKTCIYFSIPLPTDKGVYTDEMNFSFGLLNAMDTVLCVPVTVTGDTVGYDRRFSFVIDSMTGVDGVHFDLPEEGVIPAGKAKGYIPIALHRVLDDDSIYQIHLRLLPDREFELNLPESYSGGYTTDLTRATLIFSSSITKPAMWYDAYFGYFSIAKYNTFCEVCGKDASYWTGKPSAMAHLALANIFKSYVQSKILEGQSAALRDPQNKQEKGYMTMRNVSGYIGIPKEWPEADDGK